MLSRNTTWTLVRDTALGLDFAGVNYYDGQGFMVRKDLGVKSAMELGGATVCVNIGTTTELNMADYFRANSWTTSRWSSRRPTRSSPPTTPAAATSTRRTLPAWRPSGSS